MKTGRPAIAFWNRVERLGENDCWPWLGGKNNTGYGTYSYNGIICVAHRIAYLKTYGGIKPLAPKNKAEPYFVLHSCDNRLCCNPKHLHLGTYSQNQKEAYSRGRKIQPKGSSHVNSKLSAEQVTQIRATYTNKRLSQDKLAIEYGVSQHCISLLVRGETYK